MTRKELSLQERFIARDLSWLSFNERVLEEAADSTNPLMERLKFMAIFANNLDEFFMVRVAGLKRLVNSQYNKQDQFGWFAQDTLAEINSRLEALNKRLNALYERLSKELENNKIFQKRYNDLTPEQVRYVRQYFESTLYPIITPIAVDEGRPFPVLPSRTLAFAVTLSRQNVVNLAIIPLPTSISRVLKLPSASDEYSFILIDEIITANLDSFFKGYKINDSILFKLIRDSGFSGTEDFSSDLLAAIEEELKQRPRAAIVHLAIEKECSPEILLLLCTRLDFPQSEIKRLHAGLDLRYFFDLFGQVQRPQLYYPSALAAKMDYDNIFDKIVEGDFLVHLPYQSFQPVLDLLQTAASDENVLAIKMTLYRTNENSAIISALKTAAKNKKQVTVVVEIRARFDEERNISWVKELEDSGCHVMYGLVGIKIHSKMLLIVRKEQGRIRRYVHLATGNYNENTASIYTDIGYLTCNSDYAKDISDVFNVLTGYSVPSRWKRIISSPNDMRQYFIERIDDEIAFQRKNKNGCIFAKMNSLEDTKIIEKLYQASAAGVEIKLIVRGICCLVAGVEGLSENIQVKSIVGRFLEHSRIYIFHNNASPRVFLSSADWMRRNFENRIELLFEINKEELKQELISVMDIYWKDTLKAWLLQPDRTYQKLKKDSEKFNAQEELLRHYAALKA